MSVFGRTAELLFLACPSKSNQKERHPKTCWDFQSQYPHIKTKTGTRQLGRRTTTCFIRHVLHALRSGHAK